MTSTLRTLTLFSLMAFPALASAAEPAEKGTKEVQDCVRASTWDLYGEGWNVRSLKSAALPAAGRDFIAFRVNLFPGNEYMLVNCADAGAKSIVAAIYKKDGGETDDRGNPVPLAQSAADSRTPRLTFTPADPGEYLVVLKVSGYAGEPNAASVATAVTYR